MVLRGLFFGSHALALHGVLHEPEGAPLRWGAVVCSPGAHDQMRLHWVLRQLATLLARAGAPVLRFDWTGTGDSGGTLEDGSLARWTEDLRLACAELSDATGVSEVRVFATDLAATVALLSGPVPPYARLVAWNPVVRGEEHLRHLHLAQRQRDRRRHAAPTLREDELLGLPLPPALRQELLALDLLAQVPPLYAPVTVVEGTRDRLLHPLADALKARYEVRLDAGDPMPLRKEEALLLPRFPATAAALLQDGADA